MFLTKIFGDPNKRVLNKLQLIVDEINRLEPKFEKLSNEQLKEKTKEFQQRLKNNSKKGSSDFSTDSPEAPASELDNILPEAFAIVREAAKRTLGQRHFDVQLLGGVVLHRGEITEMKTGEGKTLTATLPIYLNALEGKGVHVVTVNDYLAKRDAQWMGPIYTALGLTVACIQHEKAYIFSPEGAKMSEIRNPNSEIQTPKFEIQNAPSLQPTSYKLQANLVSRQQAYACDILYGTNNEFGFDYLRDNMVGSLGEIAQGQLNYAIIDEVDSILIDEARTPLIISGPAERPTQMYYQFARLVKTLKENEDYNIDEKMRAATLTEGGIAKIEKTLGLGNIYTEGGIDLVHHLEQALKAETLFKRDQDYVIKKGEIIIVDEFTGRLMYGRRYSEGLHQAIEAKEGVEIKRESVTLATITFQNYFRLYKKLAGMTGTAVTSAEEFHKVYGLEVMVIPTNKPMIREDKPDVIYKTEEGKFKAIVEEIKARHKKGQPVLVGTISIEKNERLGEMLEREGIPHQILNAKHHEKEAEIIAQAGHLEVVTIATNMAGRGVDIVLGGKEPNSSVIVNSLEQSTDKQNNPVDENSKSRSRKNSDDQKAALNLWQTEHNRVVGLGGLHVIGSERHEARRIDNQLRGRAGRQGDPGSTQFFVSMEDDLMRIFGSEKMKTLMDRLGVPEDMPIEHKMVSKSIEAAQKRIEGYNFDLRKHLLEYDDVINKHREVIYKKRQEILEAHANLQADPGQIKDTKAAVFSPSGNKEKILQMIENEIEQVVSFHTAKENEKEWDLKEIYEVVGTIFPLAKEARIKLENMQGEAGNEKEDLQSRTKIIQYLVNLAHLNYNNLEEKINKQLITGNKQPSKVNLMREIEKGIMLRTIDSLWVEHLETMDHLRRGIGLRAYGQREPLIEYKKEAYRAFNELMNLIQKQIVYSIYKVGLAAELVPSALQKPEEMGLGAPSKTIDEKKIYFNHARGSDYPASFSKNMGSRKIGRNQPCPCGSGKKYKKCHGR